MPKVSVIIPNFNNARYIESAIMSVLQQTLQEIEVIVVDDCSTDNSWEVIQELAKKDRRIKILKNPENSGAGLSRNNGLDIATGEYVKFLDSDDTMDRDVLEVMYNAAKAQKARIVGGYMQAVNKDGSVRKRNPLFYKISDMLSTKIITPEVRGSGRFFNTVGIGDSLYERSLFDDVRFPNLKWEDFATIPIIKYGVGEAFYIDKAVYNYRQHETSTTATDYSKKTPRILDIVKGCDILRENIPEQYKEKVDYLEIEHVGARIMDVMRWEDCSESDKKRIISALYRIIKIDVPNYLENRFLINRLPILGQMNEVARRIQNDNDDIKDVIRDIKRFAREPINLSNPKHDYDTIITYYRRFCGNMDLLSSSSPDDKTIPVKENGQERMMPRSVVEQRLMIDLQRFYSSIESSNDYTEEQKSIILGNLYKASILLVPNARDHLIVPEYPEVSSYLMPEYEALSKEQCEEDVNEVVHSKNFQKYSMLRMASHCVKQATRPLMKRFEQFRQRWKFRSGEEKENGREI